MRSPWRQVHELDAGRLVIDLPGDDDVLELVQLQRAVLAEGRWFITEADEYMDSLQLQRATLRELQRQPNCIALVAKLDKRLVGLLKVTGGSLRRMRHVGKLEILVAEDARGQGVGRKLLEAVLRWARENPHVLKLGLAVYAHNDRAIKLYESAGFRREGYRKAEYQLRDGSLLDDVLMAIDV